MTENQRLKKVVKWLIGMGYASSERDLSSKLNYTNSWFSQVMNGHVKPSKKFYERLEGINPDLDRMWILTGHGEMLKSTDRNVQPGLFDLVFTEEEEGHEGQLKMLIKSLEDKQKMVEEKNLMIELLMERVKSDEKKLTDYEEKINILTKTQKGGGTLPAPVTVRIA